MSSLRDYWHSLRIRIGSTAEAGFRLQLIESMPDVRVFAAVSTPQLSPAVVVEMPENACPRPRSQLSSRAFETIVGVFPGFSEGHAGIAVQLRDSSFEDLFGLLCDEITSAVRLSRSPVEAGRAVIRSIERWRRFLDRNRRVMSEEHVRGLIGELVVLGRTIQRNGPRAALNGWVGPEDALRDFELASASVEVKTYQSSTGASVRINDPQQLDEVTSRPVYIAAVQLAELDSRGKTLPGIIGIITGMLAPDAESLEQFQDKLAAYGYLPVHSQEYNQRFVVERCLLFLVRSGFPRIRLEDVPPGVVEVHFSITLNALADFMADADVVLGNPVSLIEDIEEQ